LKSNNKKAASEEISLTAIKESKASKKLWDEMSKKDARIEELERYFSHFN